MRISDWSSDVCSSDLQIDDDQAIDRFLIAVGIAGTQAQLEVVQIIDSDMAMRLVAIGSGSVIPVHPQQFATGKLCRHFGQQLLTQHRVIDRDTVAGLLRSEEHTSEIQSLMRISYAVLCWQNKK